MAQVTISVPIETLEPGRVLAEPVFNRLGQILLSKGSKISPRHLVVLKTWGIQSAVVENGETEGKEPVLDEEVKKRAIARIKKRLMWHPQSPFEEELIQLAIQRAAQRSLRGGP
jgi:hypothetical protein